MTGNGALLSLHDATVHLGGRVVWSDVSLEVAPGEFVAVLGPNGVGKSTSARGLPVRTLGIVFLGLVGVCAAEATQAVGALLLLGLLAAPAGAAQRLTHRPFLAFWLSGAMAVLSVWLGIVFSYLVPDVPPSFGIMSVATALYLGAFVWSAIRDRNARFPDAVGVADA